MARSHLDGHPNGHGIDGAETEPHQTFNSGNGNCYHSTLINVEGNPDIMEVNMEVSKRTKPKGYNINKEQYSDSNGGKISKINVGWMFINVPIMYVDKGVK